ncbi:autotransporter outer membrane beta-barrel domain-containing protein [Myroides phaeus]|uniref:Uncharacterized protein n=1 Tax=Myroides phaeus TaxID=702745 RepID=A0A1G8DW27_9FLAO|nr:hypothetical protein [Myroides phaeus]SDH61867.1 hypothetical protein SAMN05421818_10899 [Myroides phaeus]
MKKRLLSVAFLMGAMAANAQVGIGVKEPNLSAELTVSASNRGLLIPNVKLTDTKDITTITNKNVESLLVYNIATVKDVTPGYYYWHINRWARLTADQDIPQIVVNKFEEILKMDGDKVTTLIKNLIKGNETLTVLAYNPTTGTLTYTDEKKQPTTVDIKAAVKSFETVTSIATDAVAGTITFKDEAGNSTVLNLKELVKAHETVTVLTRVAPGKYTYKNEAGTVEKINVIGDITEVIKNKTDQDLYNVLKNIVKVEETLTKLVYNAPQKQLTYTDEKAVAHNIDVEKLVQDNQIISELSAGKNISVTQVQNGNTITYTLDVPTATKDVPGVVKPGSGLDIDADGNLTVNLDSALNGKDLVGNNIIVVTDGKGAVLKETKLSVNEKEIKLENLGGTLNLTQLQNGKAGDVLVVNENGEVEWSAKEAITTNKLELVGSELVSTVNGVESKQTLKDKLTTEMLQNKSVTAEKLGATPAEQGKVPVVQKDGSVVYGNVSSDNVDGKALKSANDLMTVSLEAGVVLKDVTLTVNQGNFDLAQIGGTLKLTQLEKGKDGEVLVTDKDGTVKWVKGDNQVIKEMVKANETVTTLVDNGNGTFTYHNEDDYDVDGKLIPGKDGITFNANTLKIEAADGVYTFTDGKGELAKIDTKAKASSYDNSNSGLTSNNVQDAIDELIKKVGIVANTKGSLTSTDITVGNGTDALLKDVTLAIADGAVTTDKIKDGAVTTEKIKDGAVTTDKIEAGKDGEVLVTVKDDKGNAVTKWVPKKDATTNDLKLDGNTLVSTVNGVESNVDLTDKISNEMLKDGSVTKEKINEDVAGEGLSKNDNTGALDVDFNKVKEELAKGNVTSNTIAVTGGDKSTFKNVELEIKGGENAGDVLVTSKDPLKDDKGEVVKDENGKPVYKTEWITKKEATSNELKLEGNKLTSTVNGKEASVELTDANITSTKGIKGEGITVVGGENATLKDVTLSITAGENAGDVLVTKVDGEGNKTTEWKTPEVVATTNELSSNGNTMTSTVNGVSKEADIINSVENTLDNENKLVTTVNGVAGTGVDLTPAIVAGQEKTEVAAGHAVTVTSKTVDKMTTYTVAVDEAKINAVNTKLDGDVTGTAGANTISQLQGNPIDAKNPAGGNVLVFEGGKWINKTPVIDAGNVTNGKALTSGQNTITIDGEGSTALLKDVQIDVANGAITSDKLGKDAVTSDKIKDGAVTPGKLEAGKDGEVLTTTETKDGEGKTTTTVEWKKPVIDASTTVTGGKALTSTENTITIAGEGSIALLKDVQIDVANGAITSDKLGKDAVTSDKIKDGAVTPDKLEAGKEGQVLETVKEGGNEVVKWVDKSKPTVIKGGNSTTSNVIVTPGTNGNENEYTVDVKAAMPKVFYMPPVMFDTSKTGKGKTRNLYAEYEAMFTGNGAVVETPIVGNRPAMVKSDDNATIPVFAANELDFFVPYYDPAVFANVKIDATGKLTYDIIKKAKYGAFMTVVFVVKNK